MYFRLAKDKVSKMQKWVQSFRSLTMDCSRKTETEDKNSESDQAKEEHDNNLKPSRIPVPERSHSKERITAYPVTNQPETPEDVRAIFKNTQIKASAKVQNCPNYHERRKQILAELNKKMMLLNENSHQEDRELDINKSTNKKCPVLHAPRLKCGIEKTPPSLGNTNISLKISSSASPKLAVNKTPEAKSNIRREDWEKTSVGKSKQAENNAATKIDKSIVKIQNTEKEMKESSKKGVVCKTKSAPKFVTEYYTQQNKIQREKSVDNERQYKVMKEKRTNSEKIDLRKAIPNFEVNNTEVFGTSGQMWTQAKKGPKQFLAPEKSKTRKLHSTIYENNSQKNNLNNDEIPEPDSPLEIQNIEDNEASNERKTCFTAGQYEDPRINEFSGFKIYRKPDIVETLPSVAKEPKKGKRRKGPKGPPPLLNL